MTLELTPETLRDITCTNSVPVSVDEFVNLTFAGLLNEDETDPGALVCVNGPRPLPALIIDADGDLTGTVDFTVVSGESLIQMYDDPNGTQPVTYLNQSWPVSELPVTRYVEGLAPSAAPKDVQFRLTYNGPGGPCEDRVNLTVADREKVPLGGQLSCPDGRGCFKVYVPTRWGGRLDVTTTSGQITDLAYPDRTPYTNDTETGEDRHGWYTFMLHGATASTVSTTFVQEGEADVRPWNGWYWPTEPDTDPNLYDQGYALEKYDQVYGTSTQQWEAVNDVGIDSWEGHCWGWSVASILMPQPTATSKNGVNFTRDDMEGLYSELADCPAYPDWEHSVTGIPPGPPSASVAEGVDGYCDDLHKQLCYNVKRRRDSVQSNLRAQATPPEGIDEVWGHAIWSYASAMQEADGAANERIIHISTTIWANWDLDPPPTDDISNRVETYIYVVRYEAAGEIDGSYPGQNWISATSYAPAHILRLQQQGSAWISDNPDVIKSNVDALYNP